MYYKVKHKETGLYYQPTTSSGSNLGKNGSVYFHIYCICIHPGSSIFLCLAITLALYLAANLPIPIAKFPLLIVWPIDNLNVLSLKYVHSMSNKEIANRMNYSTKQIKRIHTKAIQEFYRMYHEEIDKYENMS